MIKKSIDRGTEEFERWFKNEIQNGMDPNEFQKYKKELKQLKYDAENMKGNQERSKKFSAAIQIYSLSEKALVNEGFLDQNFGLLNLIDIFNH